MALLRRLPPVARPQPAPEPERQGAREPHAVLRRRGPRGPAARARARLVAHLRDGRGARAAACTSSSSPAARTACWRTSTSRPSSAAPRCSPTTSPRRTTRRSRCCARTATASTAAAAPRRTCSSPSSTSATTKKNKSNPDVPECLPVQAPWAAPALDTVLLRFDEEQVFNIITYGRPGTPMPAWGVASGKGVLNDAEHQRPHRVPRRASRSRRGRRQAAQHEGARQLQEATGRRTSRTRPTRPDAMPSRPSPTPRPPARAPPRSRQAPGRRSTNQTKVVASAAAWSAQVKQMSDGEILFRLNCARCHTKGASYYDPNNIKLPPPHAERERRVRPQPHRRLHDDPVPRTGPVVQEQFDWVAIGVPANELYGVRGISSGRMPHFVNKLTKDQIKADRRLRAQSLSHKGTELPSHLATLGSRAHRPEPLVPDDPRRARGRGRRARSSSARST